jgi:hypothetical protein
MHTNDSANPIAATLNKTAMYYNVTLRRLRVIIGTAVSIKYSQCAFGALVIQHAMRMCHIVLLSAACLLYRIFPRIINGTIFGESF